MIQMLILLKLKKNLMDGIIKPWKQLKILMKCIKTLLSKKRN